MPNGHGYSFPYGVPLVIYPLLAIGIASSVWWSVACTAIAALLAGAFAWEAFSPREFDQVHAQDPTMTRLTWRMNWVLFFTVPPAVLAAFGLARWLK